MHKILKIFKKLDWSLFLSIIGLAVISLLIIGSATHANISHVEGQFDFIIKQGAFLLLGIITSIFMLKYDFHILEKYIKSIYILNIILLLIVKFAGTSALGAQRWIQIGPFTLQPSEFAKLFMIICLAKLLAKHPEGFHTWKSLIPVIALMGIPFILVLMQPDLGTSLVFGAITFGMLYACGFDMKMFKQILGGFIVSLPAIWFFLLHDYQKMRIKVLFDPDLDPFGSGYHVIQSKIAIGSGGFFGKGLFEGTQSQLNFLPENHTDFIFSVVGEELGFIGAIFLLFLYFLILYRALIISHSTHDRFGSLIAVGIFSMWLFQVFINVGMTLGIMPVTGIPLPFMSYGGSALLMNILCVGLLMNIFIRRKKLLFDE